MKHTIVLLCFMTLSALSSNNALAATLDADGNPIPFGWNLNLQRDWSRMIVFVDAMKAAREWITSAESGGPWDTGHLDQFTFDGNGYPLGLKGLDIPLPARIVSVADVFDALTSERVYKDAMPASEAKTTILQGSGSQFDPEVVAAFSACYEEIIETRATINLEDPIPSVVDVVLQQAQCL